MTHIENTNYHLHNVGAITPKIAYHEYGNMRLSSDIHRLRNEGYKILTTMRTDGKATWAEYRLEKK